MRERASGRNPLPLPDVYRASDPLRARPRSTARANSDRRWGKIIRVKITTTIITTTTITTTIITITIITTTFITTTTIKLKAGHWANLCPFCIFARPLVARAALGSPAPMPRRATRPAVHAGAPPPLPEHLAPFASVAHRLQAAVVWGRPPKRAFGGYRRSMRYYPPLTPASAI